jgi:signal recognition particle subunit SEC65
MQIMTINNAANPRISPFRKALEKPSDPLSAGRAVPEGVAVRSSGPTAKDVAQAEKAVMTACVSVSAEDSDPSNQDGTEKEIKF